MQREFGAQCQWALGTYRPQLPGWCCSNHAWRECHPLTTGLLAKRVVFASPRVTVRQQDALLSRSMSLRSEQPR